MHKPSDTKRGHTHTNKQTNKLVTAQKMCTYSGCIGLQDDVLHEEAMLTSREGRDAIWGRVWHSPSVSSRALPLMPGLPIGFCFHLPAGGWASSYMSVCMRAHVCKNTLEWIAHFGRANVRTGGLKLKWNIKFKWINNMEREMRGVEIYST